MLYWCQNDDGLREVVLVLMAVLIPNVMAVLLAILGAEAVLVVVVVPEGMLVSVAVLVPELIAVLTIIGARNGVSTVGCIIVRSGRGSCCYTSAKTGGVFDA